MQREYIITKKEHKITVWKVIAETDSEARYAVEKETDKAEFIDTYTPTIDLEIDHIEEIK